MRSIQGKSDAKSRLERRRLHSTIVNVAGSWSSV